MIISKLNITHFKNHPYREFSFSPELNCFVGNNGVGKTNILDALYYISMGKSFLGNSDVQNIELGEEFFALEARVNDGEKDDIIKVQQTMAGKKIIKKNEKIYDRIADHVGFLPNVMISPYDANLISDSGEGRRRYMDAAISQTDHDYLFALMQYQKTIQQRNALLKYFAKNRLFDKTSLEVYDQPVAHYGSQIYEKRKKFSEEITPFVQKYYDILSGAKESIFIEYDSHVHDTTAEPNEKVLNLLKENLEKDRALTYTSSGIHKDDLAFLMNGNSLKKTGSQGQQKSFLIALKLAQIHRIKSLTNKSPIVLLDDVFDKLDEQRVLNLIDLVRGENFGQIFITDTHKDRTERIVRQISNEHQLFEIKHA